MKLPAISLARVLGLLLAFSGLLIADAPPLLTTGVEIGSSNERTALNRTTRKLSSTVDVKIKNTSDRLLEAPLHAVISFTPLNGGNLAALTMPGALGGVGVAPYQTFYKDLSVSIGNGLAVGAETTFSFTFERPEGTTVSYAVAIRGIRNNDPDGVIGGPYSGQLGSPLPFDASNSTDPDGEALTFSWDFGDGSTGTGARPQHAYSTTGLFSVVVTVSDPRGAVVTRETQVPISPLGAFALARTRTLDGNGHPLGTVAVTQSGPDGSRIFQSDTVSGFTSLGGQPGDHTWSFAREGYLTSFRKTTLTQGSVKVVSFPWLAPLNASRTTLSLLNPTSVKSPAERVTLTLPPEAFEQVVSVALTDLHGQNLPLPLPYGWSPLAAFHLDMPVDAAGDLVASLKLLQNVPGTRQLALVRLDAQSLTWQTAALIAGTGTDVITAVLRKSGSYAVVIADTLPSGNPTAAVVGSPLPSGDAPSIAQEVTAVGVVNPQSTIASVDPGKVTATATVDFTNASQPLASGAWFLADVEETYDLNDGQAFKTPDYDATFYAYQTPGDYDATTSTATFPMRPRILFGPEQLKEAHIKADVLALNTFSGGILTTDGGSLNLGGIRIQVPPGAVGAPSASEIRLLNTTNLSRFLGGFEPLMAFELNLPELADGTVLNAEFLQKLSPDSNFVLARCVNSGSDSGLQPVQRLISDSQGKVTNAEPASGPRLPGITASGKYVLVKISEPQALITGLVRKGGGALLPGALVRVSAEPWLSLAGGAGTFSMLAKPGEHTVTGSDPADGNSGQATASLANAASVANVEIQTAPTGPRVVTTTPAANDSKASKVAPIIVEFSEPIQPGSFGATGIRLLDVAANVDVPGSLSLDLSNRKATLLPLNPLNNAKDYQIIVSNVILDRQSLPIDGTLSFPFKTAPSDERPAGAQLVIYEPGADNIPQLVLSRLVGYSSAQGSSHVVAHGSPGTADPEVPVILVNQNTGATATVLSKPDGSFANFIDAAEEDVIEAVFVNANGTRVTVPATRQIYDNGRIGLYKYGGILEAENDEAGKVEVIVQPQAVVSRSVFKVDLLSSAETLARLGGLLPEGARAVVAGLDVSSSEPLQAPLETKVTVSNTELGVDPAAELAPSQFILGAPVEVNGVRVFNTLAVADRLAVNGAPLPQPIASAVAERTDQNTRLKTAKSGPRDSGSGFEVTAGFSLFSGPSDFVSVIFDRDSYWALDISGSVSAESGRGLLDVNGKKRVPGAFVFAGAVDDTGAGLQTPQGDPVIPALRDGSVGALTSTIDGGFRLTAEGGVHDGNPFVFAVSSLFPAQVAQDVANPVGSGDGYAKLLRTSFPGFKTPDLFIATDRTPPRLFYFFDPGHPAALGNLSPFKLKIVATDPESGAPPTIELTLDDFFPSELDRLGETAEDNFSFAKLSETQVGNSLEQVWQMNSLIPANVRFGITSSDSSGNVAFVTAEVDVEESVLLQPGGRGPRVVGTSPKDTARQVPRDTPIIIRFSEPMDESTLTFLDNMFPLPILSARLENQNKDLVVRLDTSILPGSTQRPVTVSISSLLQDRAGNYFDQDLLTEDIFESFSFGFEYADTSVVRYPVGEAVGVVGGADMQYVLDRLNPRTKQPGLRLFRTEAGQPMEEVGSLDLPPYPRSLIDIGRYDFVQRNGFHESADLVAVVGGLAGQGQDGWLMVVDVTRPHDPQVVVRTDLGLGGTVVASKLAFSAPRLGILLSEPERTSVLEVDLQLLIYSQNLANYDKEPSAGTPGLDLNGDGDYVDGGEVIPRPQRAAPRFGLLNGGAVETTALNVADAALSRFTDFDMALGGRMMVACSKSPGHSFWMLKQPGEIVNDDESAVYRFDLSGEPTRVKLLMSQVVDLQEFGGEIVRRVLDLALVSLANGKLEVIDISTPRSARLINTLRFPDSSGSPRSIVVGRDGLLYVATAKNIVVLDPVRLGLAAPLGDSQKSFSNAYVQTFIGLGTTFRSFVAVGLDQISVASANGATFLGNSQPPSPLPVIKELEIVQTMKPKVPLGESALEAALNLEKNIKPKRRTSSGGVIEIVENQPSLTKGIFFDPDLMAVAASSPSGRTLPAGFPLWQIDTFGDTTAGFEVFERGFLSQFLDDRIPPYEESLEAQALYLLPFVDIVALSTASPQTTVIRCEDREAQVRVFSGTVLDRKIDGKSVLGSKLEWLSQAMARVVSKLAGDSFTLSGESKGSLGYKANWAENPGTHEAVLTCGVTAALDPLLGVKAEVAIPPPGPPPFVILANVFGAKFFVQLGGAITLAGIVQRTAEAKVKANGEIAGKATLALGAKAGKKLVEASISAETGITVKGKIVAPGETKVFKVGISEPQIIFEGLAMKASFKSMTGKWKDKGTSQKFTLLEPEVLFTGTDVNLIGE